MNREQWDERYRSKDLVWSEGPNRFLVEQVSDLPPGRALDLACGEGRNALWLSERGWRVRGTDFSPVAIDKARARAAAKGLDVDFAVENAATAQAQTYDLVILFYLQVPRDELRAVLAAAARAVAPGGTLLVVGHDIRNLTEGHGGPSQASVLYSPEDICAELGDLDVAIAATVERPVDTDSGVAIALDALVRATRP